ncbi:MAG: hypothetical protein GY838_04475 [bacterium]|nr:hypothetical protein [bacterium]
MTRSRYVPLIVLFALVLVAGCRSAHTTSAILYIENEQNYDKAVQVIQEGFQYRDDEPDAYYYLGEAYSHLAEEAVEANDFNEATKNYGLAYEAYARALDIMPEEWEERVVTSLKYNYNNRLSQAKRDWDEKYYEQAEGHLRLAYSAWPDSTTPIKSIARMKMQMAAEDTFQAERSDLLNEALSLLDQVLGQNPEAYDLQLDKANVLAALDRNQEAGTIYDTLLSEHGDDTVLLGEIANLAINEGDFERAGDFYIRIVDLNEADTDAANDDNNKAMLLYAGTWYSDRKVARYEDSLAALERAAEYETFPSENLMLQRVRSYYNYGKKLKDDAGTETDPVRKTELDTEWKSVMQRAVEVGVAMTNSYVTNANGFFYLSSAQLELGDFTAAEANLNTYNELSGSGTP